MNILAIDPGPTESAYVLWDAEHETILGKGILPNLEMLALVDNDTSSCLVIEQVCSYGMAVGAEVFETVFWSGRFAQAHVVLSLGPDFVRLPRMKVKQHLCHDSRARDSNIRQALIDRFGPLGKKANPGKLFGVHKDIWAALAVAVVWSDQHKGQQVTVETAEE